MSDKTLPPLPAHRRRLKLTPPLPLALRPLLQIVQEEIPPTQPTKHGQNYDGLLDVIQKRNQSLEFDKEQLQQEIFKLQSLHRLEMATVRRQNVREISQKTQRMAQIAYIIWSIYGEYLLQEKGSDAMVRIGWDETRASGSFYRMKNSRTLLTRSESNWGEGPFELDTGDS